MDWSPRHSLTPHVSFDGGDLDCGNGLLLLIRKHIDPLDAGQLLEVRSTDATVEDDLPSWCRLTKNELVSQVRIGNVRSYLVSKGPLATERIPASTRPTIVAEPVLPRSVNLTIPSFAVMGIGSWPRPAWLLRSLHEYLAHRMSEDEFQHHADDAVRLAVAAQEQAGVDVVTDGEQRRDNYASFVGTRLDNCQLIPVMDLLPYVDDPNHFAKELEALDVPMEQVRHPAVFGPIARRRPLALHELQRLQAFTNKPIKIALPGPYLLTRTMWLDCLSDKAYPEREPLAQDIVRVLREEIADLLAHGAAIVQLDEPVLTEVVFKRDTGGRSFMCGALGARRDPETELAFAGELLRAVLDGFPRERLALHICRGNWSRNETLALTGPYTPLLPLLSTLPVGTLFLEMATPRAGELDVLQALPPEIRLGLGVVNQKLDHVERVADILANAEKAISLLGPKRVWLNPDCGFATFADSPIAAADVATQKLAAIAQAAQQLRTKYATGIA